MAAFFSSNNCIKRGTYVLDEEAYSKIEIPYHLPNVPVLKKYLFKLSYEDKYRFGILTVYEYYEWMQELAEEAERKAKEAKEGHTFWASDEGERTNLAADEYADFLANNSVNVSNSTAFDFDALAKAFSDDDTAGAVEDSNSDDASDNSNNSLLGNDVNVDEILANVNKDIHGGDAILTQEEIEALFAAANAAGN